LTDEEKLREELVIQVTKDRLQPHLVPPEPVRDTALTQQAFQSEEAQAALKQPIVNLVYRDNWPKARQDLLASKPELVVYSTDPRQALRVQDPWAALVLEPNYVQDLMRRSEKVVIIKGVVCNYYLMLRPREEATRWAVQPNTVSLRMCMASALEKFRRAKPVDFNDAFVRCVPEDLYKERGGELVHVPRIETGRMVFVLEANGKYDDVDNKYPKMRLSTMCSQAGAPQKGIVWLGKGVTRTFKNYYEIMKACMGINVEVGRQRPSLRQTRAGRTCCLCRPGSLERGICCRQP
jgi:hypothetical protein